MAQNNTDQNLWDEHYSVTKVGKITNAIFNFLNKDPINSKIKNSMNKDIEKIDTVLEAGCGDGKKLSLLMNSNAKHVIGLDFSEKAVKVAHESMPDVDLICRGDIHELPFKSNSIDYIISIGVIEHFEEPLLLVNEMARVLRKNGILFLTTPNKIPLNDYMIKLDEQRFGRQDFYSPIELKKFCSSSGLYVLDAYDCDFAEAAGSWFYHTKLKKLPFQRFISVLIWGGIFILRLINPLIKNKGFQSIAIAKKN